ncbi:MAG: S41 family peptidase [Actinomycetes bacterium]
MPGTRPWLRAAAVAGAIAAAYLSGVVTGVVGTQQPANAHGEGVLDQAADHIAQNAAHPISRADLERAAVQGMLGALGDRWSTYYDPTQYASFQDVLDGRYSGVGLWVRRAANGAVVVTSVQASSSAAQAGVQVGDMLVSVAGQPVSRSSVAEVVAALRGKAGSFVTIEVRQGATSRHYRLRRTQVVDGDVEVDRLAPGVVCIRVAAFTRGVARQVQAAVERARGAGSTGIVLDLRDDPGGLLDEAVGTASAFLDGGLVVSYVRRGEAPRRMGATGDGDTDTPLVVLMNGGTASAAEVVAGALQDRGRAVLVGSQSFGKGSVQEPSQLPDGSGVELTVGHYVTPSGRSLDGVGIDPDVEVPFGASPSVADSRAVEVLHGLLADSGAAGRG